MVTESLARATQDAALASQITTVSASLASTSAALSNEVTARVSADAAQASQITALSASLATEVNTLQASIDTVSAAQTSGDAALAATINTVSAKLNAKGSNLCGNSSFELLTTSNNLADDWVAYASGAVGTLSFGTQPGRLAGRAQRVTGSALGTGPGDRAGMYRDIPITPNRLTRVQVSVYVKATASGQGRLYVATMDDGVNVSTFSDEVLLTSGYQRLWVDVTVASNIDQLRVYVWAHSRSSVGVMNLDVDDVLVEPGTELNEYSPGPGDTTGAYAAVTEERAARVTETGELSAQWSVKVDANGRWAGIQTRAGGNSSEISLLADVVRIGNAVHGSESLFVVYNVPTVVNGITLPAGVYVRDLFFGVLNGDRIIARSISTESLVVGAATSASADSSNITGQGITNAPSVVMGPLSVVSLATTGAPVTASVDVDVDVNLSAAVDSFTVFVRLLDETNAVLDVFTAVRAGAGSNGATLNDRFHLQARTEPGAATHTWKVSVEVLWVSGGLVVNRSGTGGLRASGIVQENKV